MEDKIPQLGIEPIPQIAWWKQIKDELPNSKRPIDKMPIAEILKMYEAGFGLCDTCGKKLLFSKSNFSLIDHITHMINPMVLWACEKCIEEDRRAGRIIGETTPGGIIENE